MLLLEGHTAQVLSVAYSPDSMTLASGGRDNCVRLWDLTSGRTTSVNSTIEGPILSLVFSPDGQTLAIGTSRQVALWDLVRNVETATLRGRFGGTNTVVFLSGTPRLAMCGYLDPHILIWDLNSSEVVMTLTDGHTGGVLALTHAPETAWLVSSGGFSNHGELVLWDLDTGEKKREFRVLTAIPQQGQVEWDYRQRKYVERPKPPIHRKVAHTEAVYSACLSPDGMHVASGGKDHLVRLWKVEQEEPLASLIEHSQTVAAVTFTPDGSRLLSADEGGKICVWDVATHRLRQCWDWQVGDLRSVVFAPNGMTAAAGGRRDIIVWDVEE